MEIPPPYLKQGRPIEVTGEVLTQKPILHKKSTIKREKSILPYSSRIDIYYHKKGVVAPKIRPLLKGNAPRKLTLEEIEYIVSVIGEDSEVSVRSPAEDATRIANEAIKKELYLTLANIKLVPQGITKLREKIKRDFLKSRIEAGTPVGPRVAESIAAPSTQMSLNSFHTAGSSASSNTGKGIDRMQQLVDLTKKPKVSVHSVHFKTRLNYEQVYNKIREDFLEVTVGKLVKDEEIENAEVFKEERPDWYDLYEEVYSNIPESDYVLRLTLNVKNMVAFSITMEELANIIEAGEPNTVKVVFSPLSVGIIDIYPITETILSKMEEEGKSPIYRENANNIFLNNVILVTLDKLYVKGISGVTKGLPMSIPVMSILEQETQAEENPNIWSLRLSERLMFINGVTKEAFENLLTLIGIPILPDSAHYSNLIFVNSNVRPSDVIREVLASSKTSQEIINASSYYFAEIEGGKYGDILAADDVDPYLTISNNVHEIYAIMGIEAARKFYIREFYLLFIAQDIYIDPRNIELLADFMANRGIPTPLNATGIGKQGIGALPQASFRRPMDVIGKAAIAGELKPAKETSTMILLGKEIPIGVGYATLIPDKEKEKEILKTLNKPEEKYDTTDFVNGIDELTSIIDGGKKYTLNEKDLDEIFGPANNPPLVPSTLGTAIKTKTEIKETPRPTLQETIVPAPIISDTLVEASSLYTHVPAYTQTSQTTISAADEPGVYDTLSKVRENQAAFLGAEDVISNRVPISIERPSGFTFTHSVLAPRKRKLPGRNIKELLEEI